MNLFISTSISGDCATLVSDEHHHLRKVLRSKPGDSVLISNGEGSVWEAVIESVGKDETKCRLLIEHVNYHEPRVKIVLVQGILKNHGKMDWLVEKGTELGMTSFWPIHTERTIAQSVKVDRLRKLAETAMKQCLRGYVPRIENPQHLSSALGALREFRLILFHEGAADECVPERLEYDERPLALFIGPEGGFSTTEVEYAKKEGADIVSLGKRRLRGETAGLAALTRITSSLG
ncbi:MAG: hypothetical protein C0600_04100 [Ignavibacteria bacterium]|nr:MAG: hypothetical protein C0600_04100 [Ignavibacteria bacterium]